MKTIALIFVLSCLSVSFGQAKKKNERLKMELNARLKQNDSLQSVYGSELRKLEDSIKKRYFGLLASFSRHETSISDLTYYIQENQGNLSRLKEPFSPLEETSLPDYRFTIGLRKGLLMESNDYESVPLRVIPDDKLKRQNQFLEKYIRELDSVFLLNVRVVKGLIFTNRELESLCEILMGQGEKYETYIEYLKTENTKVANQLRELEQNFRLKGPGIFPTVYQEVFTKSGESIVKDLPKAETPIYDLVDEVAEFPGGNTAMRKYLGSNFHIPEIARELGLSGKIYMKFVIMEDGTVSYVKVERGFSDCPECMQEAIRVIQSMPKWKPAMLNGKPVKMAYRLPITIHLD